MNIGITIQMNTVFSYAEDLSMTVLILGLT